MTKQLSKLSEQLEFALEFPGFTSLKHYISEMYNEVYQHGYMEMTHEENLALRNMAIDAWDFANQANINAPSCKAEELMAIASKFIIFMEEVDDMIWDYFIGGLQ